jgi:hypothetical protein
LLDRRIEVGEGLEGSGRISAGDFLVDGNGVLARFVISQSGQELMVARRAGLFAVPALLRLLQPRDGPGGGLPNLRRSWNRGRSGPE